MDGNPSAIHWDIENGYPLNNSGNDVYPYRVFNSGSENGLIVFLEILLDNTYVDCGFDAPGFLIVLHMPDEVPRVRNNYFFLPASQTVSISVKPNMMTTSEGLRSYKPHERGCYFKSERRLRFFKSYSQSNCELECLANFTAKSSVGCVRFYMPSK